MFNEILSKLLEEKKISAYKLAKDTGITETAIGYWKKGTRLPDYESIKILCDYFQVSADYLLERDNYSTSV